MGRALVKDGYGNPYLGQSRPMPQNQKTMVPPHGSLYTSYMTRLSLDFGFFPHSLNIDAGNVSIQSRPDLAIIAKNVLSQWNVEKHWFYAPPEETENFVTGAVRTAPYPSRIFSLPKTHTIAHRNADNEAHLIFHLWSLSFFTGLRLTSTEAGFLDATPLKRGMLNDFIPSSLERSVEIAETFWVENRDRPQQTRRFEAAVHALFLSQYPRALEFEKFLYLYTALDACYAMAAEMQPPTGRLPHSERAAWLCQRFGMNVPTWADPATSGGAEVADMRNEAVHEALYMGEPLGFAVHGVGTGQNLTFEFRKLICRFLVASIGASDANYIRARVDKAICQGLELD